MKRRGRPVLGAFSGFFTGLFGALSLLFNGVIPLESPLLVILPVGLMILVWAVAMWAPVGKGKAASAPAAEPPTEPAEDAG
jgi:hypothetical protein